MSAAADIFSSYEIPEGCLDEVFKGPGKPNPHYERILNQFEQYSNEDYRLLNEYAKVSFLHQGVTYAVYSDSSRGIERIFPFDLFPRIIPADEWAHIETGAIQRAKAINAFLYDIYHERKIIKAGIVPAELVDSSPDYRSQMIDLEPQGGIYCHISGTDLIKHKDGKYYVLEDNARNPSGVSYVLSNREAMKKTMATLFQQFNIASVWDYPEHLLDAMKSVAPEGVDQPICVLLTPGVFNSAYYEHAFLAQSMGIELVEGRDLFCENKFVYMKTIHGPRRVDVIYRRIDDEFLDPQVFHPDSMLGVRGLMEAYRENNVTIMNAPGCGAADDKATYVFVPDMIRFYLKEEPILQNVPTYICERKDEMQYVLDNIEELVIKPVNMSGGYGIHMGNRLTEEEKDKVRAEIKADPRGYIAQPIMSLSLHSTYIEDEGSFEPRHIDLRTYTLLGKDYEYVLKGGLSRVALTKGSLVVNSSQGGGSKDTWVLCD